MAENALRAPTLLAMSMESVDAYVKYEEHRGTASVSVKNYRRFVTSLLEWLPEDKCLTKERLRDWRQSLREQGYSPQTELNYVKGINRYLDFMGYSEIRFNRGGAKNIAGKQFGYLTAVENTGRKNRKDCIWRCVCHCGNEVEYPATRLLTGNTISCGCLRKENLRAINKYIEGTSIRLSVEEKVRSSRAKSGYTGVIEKGNRWMAYIHYKGEKFYLGYYSDLQDAVKARARAKELVRLDAMRLWEFYEELHKNDPVLPNRKEIKRRQRRKK